MLLLSAMLNLVFSFVSSRPWQVGPQPPVAAALPPEVSEDFPVRLSRLLHDAGRVEAGTVIEGTVWFQNVSGREVPVAYAPKQGLGGVDVIRRAALAPGEWGRIDYCIDTRRRQGELHKWVLLQVEAPLSDDPRAVGMEVTGLVLPEIFIDPPKLALLDVPTTHGAEQTIMIYGRGIDFDVDAVCVQGGDPSSLAVVRGRSEAVFLWDELYIRVPFTLRVAAGTPIGEHQWNIAFSTNRVEIK